MLKKIALAAVFAIGSTAAMADNDIGCGVGTQVWAGKQGVVPKLLAATTNGISTNQLLGITFGAFGCAGFDKTISAQVVSFVDENAETLARDTAVGEGESLNVLANLMNIKSEDKAHFFAVTKANWSEIFSSENQNTMQVLSSLQSVMAKDTVLSTYS